MLTQEELNNINLAKLNRLAGIREANNHKEDEAAIMENLEGEVPLLFTVRDDSEVYFVGNRRVQLLRAIRESYGNELRVAQLDDDEIIEALRSQDHHDGIYKGLLRLPTSP